MNFLKIKLMRELSLRPKLNKTNWLYKANWFYLV